MIPRSLTIKQPYRGRTLRGILRNKIPVGGKILNAWFDLKSQRINASGQRRLQLGAKEGRRFISAVPHPFCGIGHSHSEWHTAYQWAPRLGLEFAHIPLQGDWDHFFGLSGLLTYEEVLTKFKPDIVRVPIASGWTQGKDVFQEIHDYVNSIHSDRDLLFVLADAQNTHDHVTPAEAFRERFRTHGAWQDLPSHRIEGRLNVAVHLRRGDVAQMAQNQAGNWEQRYITEDWFIAVMDAVVQATEGAPVAFHIYSQGSPLDFPLLAQYENANFHLDAGEEETLLNMSKADVLVMSPSGFSYLAAMLSAGLKIARYPWWHWIPDRSDWIRVEGQVKVTKIAEKLIQLQVNP